MNFRVLAKLTGGITCRVALVVCLSLCPVFADFATNLDSPPLTLTSARMVTYQTNPGGLQIGFWANQNQSLNVLKDFGPRPIERVNFHKWYQHEKSPGVYDFKDAFLSEQWAHLAGSTVISNVNTFFTHQLNPKGMHAMPSFYAPTLDDPETRAAARRYLEAFVEALLEATGTAWLVLDYEMLWFARPVTPEIRQAYRDWFIEASGLARATAARLGMSDRLKIGVIVNTNPFDTARRHLGNGTWPWHRPESWLLDCVAVADFFGIDTYAGGHVRSVSAQPQLEVMKFWIKHYAGDLPVYVTESGFTTSRQHGDASHGYHIRGTENEQAVFFREMFHALTHKNSDPLLARIDAYCIWKYRDRNYQENLVERHLGIRHDDADRTPKPAFFVVQKAIRTLAADPVLAPVKASQSTDVLEAIKNQEVLPLFRRSGTVYSALELTVDLPEDSPDATHLSVTTDSPVCLIVEVNDKNWVTTHPHETREHRLLLPGLEAGKNNRINIQVTSARYPVNTGIGSLKLQSTSVNLP